jgi:hypothetical protein
MGFFSFAYLFAVVVHALPHDVLVSVRARIHVLPSFGVEYRQRVVNVLIRSRNVILVVGTERVADDDAADVMRSCLRHPPVVLAVKRRDEG